jgi:predicted nucleic acid-binding protein
MSLEPPEQIDLVIDASIGVKWLIGEVHSTEAAMLMDNRIRRHVPVLFFTEVAQTIWKKVHIRQELSVEEGRQIFDQLVVFPLQTHPIEPLLKPSFEIALQTRRTMYDCVYLALARANGWRFVTADERLYNALKGDPLEPLIVGVADIHKYIRTI